jgi:hypothetical protein
MRAPIFLALILTPLAGTLDGQQGPPPVFLNHLTIVLPSTAYAEIGQSLFLKNELSAFAERTNTAESDAAGRYTYTGIYLRGRHTYLECFEAGTVRYSKPGVIGFNLSIDDRRQLPVIRDRFAAEAGEPVQIGVTRNGTTHQPSYDFLFRASQKTLTLPGIDVVAVVKAYYPDGITREKQREKEFLPDRLLKDVAGVAVTVNQAELANILQVLRASGYSIRKEGVSQIASGPEITFTLIPERADQPRILVLDLLLNREKSGEQSYRFGADSELHFRGATAKWTFRFPKE